jgi:hypothetical protein
MKALFCPLVTLALCAAMPAIADDGKRSTNPTESASALTGMRAGIDRNTGRFRELTPAEQQELDARGNGRGELMALLKRGGVTQPETAAEAEAERIILPNGAEIMPLPLELMVSLEAHVDADGYVVTGHNDASIDRTTSKELPHE